MTRLPTLQPHALLQRVKSCISDEEEEKLMQITSLHSLNAFLLPIKTVGVQVTLTGTGLHRHPPGGHVWYCSKASPPACLRNPVVFGHCRSGLFCRLGMRSDFELMSPSESQ